MRSLRMNTGLKKRNCTKKSKCTFFPKYLNRRKKEKPNNRLYLLQRKNELLYGCERFKFRPVDLSGFVCFKFPVYTCTTCTIRQNFTFFLSFFNAYIWAFTTFIA